MVSENLYSAALIGKTVILPDGEKAKITSICVTGQFYRVEWLISSWYKGEKRSTWLEPNEVKLEAEDEEYNQSLRPMQKSAGF